jgi:hypothetical protein
MEVIGFITSIIVIIIASTIWKGYVLTVLWKWFVVPAFGLPLINIPTAIGICSIMTFLTMRHKTGQDERDLSERVSEALILSMISPAIFLFGGWIVKFWC